MRVEWGTHSLESLNHLSPFIKLVRAVLKGQGNLLDLVYWKKYIIKKHRQNYCTGVQNISLPILSFPKLLNQSDLS